MNIMEVKNLSWPEKLGALAVMILEKGGKTGYPLEHIFEPGVYIREMRIPAGQYFIGRAHRHGHRIDLCLGSVRLIAEKYETYIDAPYTLITVPYFITVCEALEDVVARTYHPNPYESRDIEALEAEAFLPASDLLTIGHNVIARLAALEAA